MSEPTTPKKSGLGAFLGGFSSGAINGALMLGLYTAVGVGILHLGFIGWLPMAATVITTGLFSGIMAAKRAFSSHGSEATEHNARTTTIVPVVSQGVSMSPSLDVAEAQETSRGNWTDRVGRREDNVQKILANGSLSDKDRASALLAEREQNAASNGMTIH